MTGVPHARTSPGTREPELGHIDQLPTLMIGEFPSLKARQLLRILRRLGYAETRRRGSHRWLEAEEYPKLLFTYHDRASIPPGLVRDMLVKDVSLAIDEALKVVHDD